MTSHEAVKLIIETLLALPVDEREEVFTSVKHNGIFCTYCGIGDMEHPNNNCQCWNDE
jgi:hypothetical protein